MSILGTRVIRTEDPRLLTAGGVYVDDLRTPELNGAARVMFVRSPVAHARITGIDASELAEPGVIAVLTVADMDDLARRRRAPARGTAARRRSAARGPSPPGDRYVRFVGEPVAMVITDTSYQGEDAADLVRGLRAAAGGAGTDGRRRRRDPAVPGGKTNVAIAHPVPTDDAPFDACEVVARAGHRQPAGRLPPDGGAGPRPSATRTAS
jgi:carbon-monoxide dehydrogenase large subunit